MFILKINKILICFLFLAVLSSACSPPQHEKPNFIYMSDMVYSPSIKAQEVGSMRMPVKGTIPRGYQPYLFPLDPEKAGKELKNPLHRTAETFVRGQQHYQNYCMVCHGPLGEGDGSIIPKFPKPPSLQSDKVMQWSDGRIYHVISMGQNLMPSYASQIAQTDRWAIIHYLRALQRAKHPTAEDLNLYERGN